MFLLKQTKKIVIGNDEVTIMEKQGWISVWLGNIREEDSIEEYVDLTYDEDGESVPSPYFNDFNIDMDETDEDTIEKVVYKKSNSDISTLLAGCSYEEFIIPKIKNAVILIYNFEYNNEITSTGAFDFIAATKYE